MLPVVAVVGPTASGKSELAVRLAAARAGEIINLDASQLYRGMDIGTAKMPLVERRDIPHHLLDVLEIGETASVAEFQVMARQAIDDIRRRERLPVCVGGSGLYVRAVLEELTFPDTDPDVRSRLEEELARSSAAAMHARLALVDPLAAAAIVPGNTRRVIRALEVMEITGRPFEATLPEHSHRESDVRLGLRISKEVLAHRIRERVRRMWEAGLVDEVRALESRGLRAGVTAAKALGYQQVLAFLAGELTENEAFEATVHGTMRFARRQMQWFKRDPRIEWFDFDDPALFERSLAAIDRAQQLP